MLVLAAVRDKKVLQRSDGHLELADGLTWPGTNSRVLFVRPCYAPLFEAVLHHCQASAEDAVYETFKRRITTGQSGTGKTMWGCVTSHGCCTRRGGDICCTTADPVGAVCRHQLALCVLSAAGT